MKIHFIGIGGIGVSALARYFLARGDEVSGSDMAESGIVAELREAGAKIPLNPPLKKGERVKKVFINRKELNPPSPPLRKGGEIHPDPPFIKEGTDLVIYSAAVREDNPELVEARRLGVPCQKYAQALGELTKQKFTIAVSGMHGKSTTTAMIGLIMAKAGLDPTVIVGTKVKWCPVAEVVFALSARDLSQRDNNATSAGIATKTSGNVGTGASNFRAGQSKYLVIEADEYDRSILNYWPKVLVLLNIEEEHLDTYTGGLADIMKTFEEYASHLPGDGILVANEEDNNISKLLDEMAPTPAVSSSRGERQGGRGFRVIDFSAKEVDGLKLKILGQHNLSNANAALAAARVLGIDEKVAVESLNNFMGIWRRMEYKGKVNGAKIYDDYGHHPTEIKATLRSAVEIVRSFGQRSQGDKNATSAGTATATSDNLGTGALWVVFQPHQYQRTYDLFDKFVDAFDAADKVILLPIYSVAGRENGEIKKKVSSERLAQTINNKQLTINNKKVLYMDNFGDTIKYLRKNLQPGDVCVIMGAGDIYKLTEKLISEAK